jgi:hypothetical protein
MYHILNIVEDAFDLKGALFCPTSGLLGPLVTVDVGSWTETVHITNNYRLPPFGNPWFAEDARHKPATRFAVSTKAPSSFITALIEPIVFRDLVDVVDWRLVNHIIFVGGIVPRLIALRGQAIVVKFVHPLQLQDSCVRHCIVDAVIVVRICWIPAKMDPWSSSPDAMTVDDSVKFDHFFKTRRFKLMAIGASHAKLGSSINICKARDLGVLGHSSIAVHSTPFGIPNNREQQLVEKQNITSFHARSIQSKSTQLISIQAAFLLLGNLFLSVTCVR